MFVDFAKITVEAGDGGDGCIAFLREKYVPHGGPCGGDGGRGGHVYAVADAHMATLLDFKARAVFKTQRGAHGGGSNCTGRDAEDMYVQMPLGTIILDAETEEVLADLTTPGQTVMIGRGGNGGRGNQHFATSTNKAPRKFTYGEDGEKRRLILELKVIADVGLVGLPNAGKSTLLSHLTAATPKIASYPFTTIHPNLGVCEFGVEGGRFTIADIPGLIEGAHMGAGLGDRFLRHIERTKVLVHLVAPQPGDNDADLLNWNAEDLLFAYDLIRNELETYSPELLAKPQIVCLSKADLLPPDERDDVVAKVLAAFKKERDVTPLLISAESEEGLDVLRERLSTTLADLGHFSAEESSDSAPEVEPAPAYTPIEYPVPPHRRNETT